MPEPRELDDETYQQVTAASSEGNGLVEAGDLDGALESYRCAMQLIPEPRHEWEAATWLFVAMGDVLYQQRRYQEARELLNEAMRCPGAIRNPFVHLRLGQVQYELKNPERAKDELARAYMGGGDETFEGEDPKYKLYIKEILRPREDI
jgi:tetratricopeptide (TPR) repeat protein